MAENKTKPTQISVDDYIAAITDQTKREDARKLVALMTRATGEEPKMWGPSIIGFGTRHYRYESGREGETLVVGFSPRKPAIVLYGLRAASDVDSTLAKLGKHTTGKGCVYIKKLADVDEKVLVELITESANATQAKH